ncbi:MAG: AraC family transcriptional regulator ligand-binding domain-containing protein [Alphaproteobacteria bacterium]|nr:AraC family transcriptional regulator ligand-binding domain-containing protein [Alphaproteobacteria bacterium]
MSHFDLSSEMQAIRRGSDCNESARGRVASPNGGPATIEPIALTRASQLIDVTDTLERIGVSPEQLLVNLGLPMWHFCGPDDLIPTRHIYTLLGESARLLGNRMFGLHVGLESNIATLGSYGNVISSAFTIKDALERSCRLIHLHSSDARLRLIRAGDEVWFCRSEFRGPKFGRTQIEQYVLTRLIDYVRIGAGPSWQPAKVHLQTHEAPGHELRHVLGNSEIRIGQKVTAIAVPHALLALPLRHHRTPSEASDAEEARLRDTAPATDFCGSLRQLAVTLLNQEGQPRIETMAEITGLSVRSLQRRLASCGLTYIQIVDQARYQVATRLLEASDIRITDVAMNLGYADSAHFTRAFKRWAGITPREYRSSQMMH